jgi:feruloyl esterase
VLASILLAAGAAAHAEDSCGQLSATKISGATITLAQAVAAGTFVGPPNPFSGADASQFYKTLPAFCRVVVEAKPTADSDIKIEVWLPVTGWNGKLQGTGNGGFAGLIDDMQLGMAVRNGYAATATDTGHAGSPGDAAWAMGHPEKVADFGYRGIHEMTRVAKVVVQAYYSKTVQRSYFAGCSDGGREALMEAQRYPEDYDGILAGAPANYWTRLLALGAYDTQVLTMDAASFIPPAKIPAMAAAVNAACDEKDGVKDGILNDPRQCHFDPATIGCKAGEESEKCLTAVQVASLNKIYAGLSDSRGNVLFPGYLPGAEEGPAAWGLWITGRAPGTGVIALFSKGYFSNFVYEKADWDIKTFSVDAGLKAAEEKTAAALNAIDPDLKAFKERGGKLILYHGWNDPAIPALNTVNYYENVVAKMGRKDAESFVRLYMVPGMQHCGGGPGATSFGFGNLNLRDPARSIDAALELWVEKGVAPGTIIAAKYEGQDWQHPVMTRPLCVYPEAAKYKGSGDTNDAKSFECVEEKK